MEKKKIERYEMQALLDVAHIFVESGQTDPIVLEVSANTDSSFDDAIIDQNFSIYCANKRHFGQTLNQIAEYPEQWEELVSPALHIEQSLHNILLFLEAHRTHYLNCKNSQDFLYFQQAIQLEYKRFENCYNMIITLTAEKGLQSAVIKNHSFPELDNL